MFYLQADSLTKYFGPIKAVDNVSFRIERGQFVSILGPSGSGKSTLLRLIAGLERPSHGSLQLDGHDITHQPPHKRNMAMVVQNYALFPHMTVYENIAYGLRVRHFSEKEIHRRVMNALDLVRLQGLQDRFPHQLSGGQQQRCALARALVVQPRVLLLDEALGALDQRLRETMRIELRQLQLALGVTTIHVTHDQREALSLSDIIIVLNNGRVEQIGTSRDIYYRPRSLLVAQFVGDTNIFEGFVVDVTNNLASVETDDGLMIYAAVQHNLNRGEYIRLLVRPEFICITRHGHDQPVLHSTRQTNIFVGTVEAAAFEGDLLRTLVRINATRTVIVYRRAKDELEAGNGFSVGDNVLVCWKSQAMYTIGEDQSDELV